MVSNDRIGQVRDLGVATVARAFGVAVTDGLGIAPCPACGATVREHRTTRKNAPPINIKVEGGAVYYCFECDEGGSAFDFAAYCVLGHRAERHECAEVLQHCAARGLCDAAAGDSMSVPLLGTRAQPALALTTAPLPDSAEVAKLWAGCVPLHRLARDNPSRGYLEGRGFDPDLLAWAGDMARAMPTGLPMPEWWPNPWCATWPVIFPAYDAHGSLVSLHARAITKDAEPKTRWPKGRSLGGVLFADGSGLNFLRSWRTPEELVGLDGIVIVEGATDTLKLAQVFENSPVTWGVLGYCSGSRQALEQISWPSWLHCILAVDDDEAGDAYALEVRRALPGALMFRVRPPVPRVNGKKGVDWSEMSDDAVRDALADVSCWEPLP